MEILYINAMEPRESSKQGGIFVSKRIEALLKFGINILPVAFYIDYTKSVRKLLELKGIPYAGKPVNKQLGIVYEVKSVQYNLAEMIFSKIKADMYGRKIAHNIDQLLKDNENVDLIHLHWIWPVGVGVLEISKQENIPYVITCHGSDVNIAMADKVLNKHIVTIMEGAAVVEFVSKALFEKAVSLGYSGKNGCVIYNGIDTEIFNKRKKKKKDKKKVGFAGNLIPVKGADRLPDIFGKIYKGYKDDIEFVVIGGGELRDRLEKELRQLPVRFTGQISQKELADEFAEMDVLIVPSRSEGYSCVIKEAQACGVIPVANDVGGIREAVGDYGTVISAGSEENITSELAKCAIKYISGSREVDIDAMSEEASRCSWTERQKSSVRVYSEILKKLS